MKPNRSWLLPISVVFPLCLMLAVAVLAGPPLICHAFDIGDAKSLPWISHDWNLTGSESYDTSRLASDTIAILAADNSVLVHMETLRRATLYARKDPVAAKALLTRITMGTKSAQPSESRALTYFDSGYLAEAYKQWLGEAHNPATGIDGYALVEEAIRIRGSDPQMELAAALITLNGPVGEHQAHAQKAVAGAKTDRLLARNLSSRFFPGQGPTIAEMISKTTVAERRP
jgi:hypothetical protein